MTTATSGVIARFPLLLPVRNLNSVFIKRFRDRPPQQKDFGTAALFFSFTHPVCMHAPGPAFAVTPSHGLAGAPILTIGAGLLCPRVHRRSLRTHRHNTGAAMGGAAAAASGVAPTQTPPLLLFHTPRAPRLYALGCAAAAAAAAASGSVPAACACMVAAFVLCAALPLSLPAPADVARLAPPKSFLPAGKSAPFVDGGRAVDPGLLEEEIKILKSQCVVTCKGKYEGNDF